MKLPLIQLATQTPQEPESTEAFTPTTQENESEKILAPDLEIEAEGKEKVWIEMQRWNNKKEELSFFRWEKLRLTQLELHENEQCFLLVLYDTEDGSDELWQDFRDEEMAVYSMMSKKPLEKTNIYLFPVVANGVMIFLNLNKLSQRKDEIGENETIE